MNKRINKLYSKRFILKKISMVVKFMTNGKSSLKEELDITKRKLQNMSQLNDQLKTRNTYLQNRMSPLVKEKQE